MRKHMPCVPLCREDSCRAAVKGENRRFSTRCVRARSASDDQPGVRAQGAESDRPRNEVTMWRNLDFWTNHRSEATWNNNRYQRRLRSNRSTFSRASRRSKICFGEFQKKRSFRFASHSERHARDLNSRHGTECPRQGIPKFRFCGRC